MNPEIWEQNMNRLRRFFNQLRYICRQYTYDKQNPYRRWDRMTGQREEYFVYRLGGCQWEPCGGPNPERAELRVIEKDAATIELEGDKP